jgi:hypothetical protein
VKTCCQRGQPTARAQAKPVIMPAAMARSARGRNTQTVSVPMAMSRPATSRSTSLGAGGRGTPASSAKSRAQISSVARVPFRPLRKLVTSNRAEQATGECGDRHQHARPCRHATDGALRTQRRRYGGGRPLELVEAGHSRPPARRRPPAAGGDRPFRARRVRPRRLELVDGGARTLLSPIGHGVAPVESAGARPR